VMGAVYENQTKWDQLIDVDRKLIALDPTDVDQIRHRLVESLITTGRADEARKQFELLRANSPELLQSSPLTEARLLHVEGRIDDALVILERVLAVSPNDSKALLLKGRIELARSKPEQAIQALNRLTEIAPTDNEAHYLLGQAYARSGDDVKAKHHLALHRRVLDLKVKLYELERQANRNPADVELRLQIADLYGQLGWNDRVQFWREAAQSASAMRGD
jgi:tetratricopeptide (TPR) repeat protein